MSSRYAWLKVLILALAILLAPLALLLGICGVTWTGRLLALSALLTGIGPLLWTIGSERRSRVQVWSGRLLLVLGTAILIGLAWRSPDGHTSEEASLHSRYSDGGWHYQRFNPGGLLPEIDQIHLGFAAALALDPLFNSAQLKELSAMTDVIYREMARNPEFEASGSALTSIYDEMASMEFRNGHYYHYIPPNLDRAKPSKALVFLHGSGGNFKAYVWLLSKVADRVGCTVIAPTFGLGSWNREGAYDTVTAAVRDAGRHSAMDPDQIHLMGLSNGGIGVCLAESAPGPRFRSLIFLSGVFHHLIQPEDLARRMRNRPALVLSGGRDDRVPWDYVEAYATRLESEGMEVVKHCFEEDDHFLFFRRKEKILSELSQWIESH